MTAPTSTFQLAPEIRKVDLRPVAIDRAVVIRTPSGLSGDMLVTGLAKLWGVTAEELDLVVSAIGLPELTNCLRIEPFSVNEISGWKAQVTLGSDKRHRSLAQILSIIEQSHLSDRAKQIAANSFRILGEAESKVHGIAPADVHFHEVGALDSILDTCVAAALLERIGVRRLVCSPLPLCDGTIRCEHGMLASPAPAVQEMLAGVPVYGVRSSGETVTPTALAFLKGAGAEFGPWPPMTVHGIARVYGGRLLPGIPNGAIFAVGSSDAHMNSSSLTENRS
jgi:uncharacterized protein (DUF111 family)